MSVLKADLLALQASQNDAMVAAINQIEDAVSSPDPIQVQLDEALAKLADAQAALQAEIVQDQADAAKAAALQAKIDSALAALQLSA